ncbi:MAG TPA: hypothetical protein VMA73_12900 [Streptosporangiaceae bacterium]|nr:hypothetical protein [Streptosporangiaceae bacterium]
MSPRSRGTRRPAAPAGGERPRPPAGGLEPVTDPPPRPAEEPVAPPALRVVPQPGAVRLFARFGTASAALAFIAQLPGGQPISEVRCLRGGPGDGWWVPAEITLEAAREMVSVTVGRVYLPSGGQLIRDRGWGDSAATGQSVGVDELRDVSVLQLVQVAGLYQYLPQPLREAVLLMPGFLISGITRRALDLHLAVTYRPVELISLFEPGDPARTCYELCLSAGGDDPLPASLVAALDRLPFVLVCRRVADSLLIRHAWASALPDLALATLPGEETWVMADAAYGCARLNPLGEPQDGASLVRCGEEYQLVDISREASWVDAADMPSEPVLPEVTLVPARMSGVRVDAALLDDADLACLPGLLMGQPLAESAVLIRGRDRHLLTAPGGLLEQLPIGEPLCWIGPGNLYLPLGYRLQPLLPAAARAALFPTDATTAVILLPGTALRYDLETRRPVWLLWAGPAPVVQYQVPPAVNADLAALDKELAQGLAPKLPAGGRSVLRRIFRTEDGGAQQHDWHDEAYAAELAGDYAAAAELHLKYKDPMRAARLFERAAELEN